MKNKSIFLLVLSISATALFSSFMTSDITITETNSNPPDEFEVLLNYLETTNTFVNTESLPIIMADEVKKNMKNPKFHVIDIRNEGWFEYGHIKNAANVKAENLLTHFESTINPVDFDKIVLVCYSGQSAAYYSSLLKIAGYNNVYSMKWGMSSWREDFADNAWNKNIKNEYASKLESTERPNQVKDSHPILNTGKIEVKEILKARLETLFATPYKEFIVKSADVFENPSNYYVINYLEEDKCIGHIPGTFHFQPDALSFTKDLLTLPANQKVVVYETTGQKSAYMVAYLNVLGYNTGNLAYGANSFMNELLKEKGEDAFSQREINMYPVIE